MNVRTAYLHVLDGRLRVKIAEAKGSPAVAREIEEHLRITVGVDHVSANPTTGNVLVLFDPGRTDQSAVLRAIRDLGYLEDSVSRAASRPAGATGGVLDRVVETAAKTTIEFALQSLVAALI